MHRTSLWQKSLPRALVACMCAGCPSEINRKCCVFIAVSFAEKAALEIILVKYLNPVCKTIFFRFFSFAMIIFFLKYS